MDLTPKGGISHVVLHIVPPSWLSMNELLSLEKDWMILYTYVIINAIYKNATWRLNQTYLRDKALTRFITVACGSNRDFPRLSYQRVETDAPDAHPPQRYEGSSKIECLNQSENLEFDFVATIQVIAISKWHILHGLYGREYTCHCPRSLMNTKKLTMTAIGDIC